VLYAGTIVEEAPVDALYASPQHPYTIGLLNSLPKLSPGGEAEKYLPSIGGTPPEPGRRPKGCPFAPRCARKMSVCETLIPRLESLAEDAAHRVACFAVTGAPAS
jgi:peptide/nickel transport system ATP-binding protein